MNGLLLVDKPAGPTSHDVVEQVRRRLNLRKAGHAGTLDPQATGLLVLALGNATRWLPHLPGDKRYRATVKLGLETDTQDIWGKETARGDASKIGGEQFRRALESLKDAKEQVPPMVSALKHQGKPLYAWARQGVEIERAARPLEIFGLQVTAVRGDEADFEVHCGSGTYVRSLCAQVGKILGTGACMAALRRTAVGPFWVEEASDRVLDAGEALAHLKAYEVAQGDLEALAGGRDLKLEGEDHDPASTWRMMAGQELLALGSPVRTESGWKIHPKKVFSKA